MAKQLDVYRDWLQIPDEQRPLNYYQLLKLKPFEDDPAVVRSHYRKLNAHVRKFAAGQYAQQSQDLLNEIAKAMLCLTDEQRKSDYDASLGRTTTRQGGRRAMEQILLATKAIDPPQLDKARNLARTLGVELRDALLQQKAAPPEAVMQAFAESIGLPFVDLAELQIEESLVPVVPAVLARQQSCVPLMRADGQVLVATPHPLTPEVEDQLRLRFDQPVRTVLCTPAAINEAVLKYYPKEAAAREMSGGGAAAAKKAATAPAAGASAAQPAASPLDRAARKKRLQMAAIIGANFTALTFFVVGSFITNWALKWGFAKFYGTAALLAVVGALVGYVVGSLKS